MKNTKLKVAVVGTGAIGTVIGHALNNRPDLELYFLNRSPRTTLTLQYRERTVFNPVQLSDPGDLPVLDWCILCLKEYQYAKARPILSQVLSPSTNAVVLRNGLKHQQSLAGLHPEEQILPAIIDAPTQLREGGGYHQLKKGVITVPAGPLGKMVADLCISDHVVVELTADFHTACWQKVISSASLGGILALTGQTCVVLQDPAIWTLFQQLLEEGIRVAIADGATLPSDYLQKELARCAAYPSGKGSSMLTDRLAGRPIEIMAKNGVIAELASKRGVQASLHRAVAWHLGRY